MRIEARRIRGVGCDRHSGLQSSSYEIGRGARCLDLRVVPRVGGLRELVGSAPRADGAGRRPDTAARPRASHSPRTRSRCGRSSRLIGRPSRPAVPRDRTREQLLADAADASYGVGTEDFAKQMTMIQHAGYETIDLQTLIDFVQNKPVDLPPRPLLLTFDDARADSWTGADGILRKLRFNAVMFVDVGRVDGGDPEYLTWHELAAMQDSGRWQLQLHSGKGHTQIHYGPGADDYGPFYAYKQQGEDFDGWRDRVHSDIAWGQTTLADHISAYRAARFRSPVRQLRPGRHQRLPDPRRPPRLAHKPLRRRLHPGRQRTSASRSRTAARAESRSPAPPPEATCTRCCSPARPDGARSRSCRERRSARTGTRLVGEDCRTNPYSSPYSGVGRTIDGVVGVRR